MDTYLLDDLIPRHDPTTAPRVLARETALRLGYSRRAIDHRLATGRWRLVLPRTYLTVDTLTWADRKAAAVAFAGPGAVLTAAAALADEGLKSVPRPQSLLVLVPRATGVRDTGWVRIRRTSRMPAPPAAAGSPRAPFARAVADLALERIRLDDVRALVAEAVRRRLCTVDELASELEAGPRRGSALLRQSLPEVARGAWSAPEARAARILRRAAVPPFEQNGRIELPGGGRFVADFLWRALRAVLEIDSREHHYDQDDWDATMDRHLKLETLGYSVVHRNPSMLTRRPGQFARDIEEWLATRAQEVSGWGRR